MQIILASCAQNNTIWLMWSLVIQLLNKKTGWILDGHFNKITCFKVSGFGFKSDHINPEYEEAQSNFEQV